jgi:hypothetical protein
MQQNMLTGTLILLCGIPIACQAVAGALSAALAEEKTFNNL